MSTVQLSPRNDAKHNMELGELGHVHGGGRAMVSFAK